MPVKKEGSKKLIITSIRHTMNDWKKTGKINGRPMAEPQARKFAANKAFKTVEKVVSANALVDRFRSGK